MLTLERRALLQLIQLVETWEIFVVNRVIFDMDRDKNKSKIFTSCIRSVCNSSLKHLNQTIIL